MPTGGSFPVGRTRITVCEAGQPGLEPGTSVLETGRYHHLSYCPSRCDSRRGGIHGPPWAPRQQRSPSSALGSPGSRRPMRSSGAALSAFASRPPRRGRGSRPGARGCFGMGMTTSGSFGLRFGRGLSGSGSRTSSGRGCSGARACSSAGRNVAERAAAFEAAGVPARLVGRDEQVGRAADLRAARGRGAPRRARRLDRRPRCHRRARRQRSVTGSCGRACSRCASAARASSCTRPRASGRPSGRSCARARSCTS